MFDANVHPTVDGTWIDGRALCDFGRAEATLREAGFVRACAVALPGVGGYDAASFAQKARAAGDFWVPIAAWESVDGDLPRARAAMQALRTMGYRGVKLHPRLLGRMPAAAELAVVVRAAADEGLPVLICSYPFGSPESKLRGNLLEVLSEALEGAPQAPVMLLHAGCVDLLRYIEFARANPAVMLDLSFTIMKYRGSSLDLDLAFAFRTFDQRLCLGSDFPQYSPRDVRQRFDELAASAGIGEDKVRNIASANAARFFGVDAD